MTEQEDREIRLQAILDWLAQGRITAQQAAGRIRALGFPELEDRTPHQVRGDDANGDPEPPGEGSPFAIADAYAAGRINAEQYAVLARAAAEATGRVPGA